MSHLSIEEIARLVDEPPDADEALHLGGCESCRAELDAMRDQAAALAALPDPRLPDAVWTRVESRLAAEGLIQAPARQRFGGSGGWLRFAAAVALFAAGGVSGAAWRAAPGGDGATGLAASSAESELAAAVPVSQRVRAAEAAYLRALAEYAEQGDGSTAYDPVARLAALESIMLTSQAALNKAPADPVINGYYLTAIAQRDAVLKQFAAPADTATWF